MLKAIAEKMHLNHLKNSDQSIGNCSRSKEWYTIVWPILDSYIYLVTFPFQMATYCSSIGSSQDYLCCFVSSSSSFHPEAWRFQCFSVQLPGTKRKTRLGARYLHIFANLTLRNRNLTGIQWYLTCAWNFGS